VLAGSTPVAGAKNCSEAPSFVGGVLTMPDSASRHIYTYRAVQTDPDLSIADRRVRLGRMQGKQMGLWCLGAIMLLAGCGSTSMTTSVSHPAAKPFTGLPQVGALFAGPAEGGVHFCTASVVHSPRHNLLITAAHCLSGTGSNLVFVPGYHDGISPFGSWSVGAVYASTRWLTNHDPREDYAFLTLELQQRSGRAVAVEDVVGGDHLVISQGLRVWATVIGYPLGTSSNPITCRNETYDHGGYPTFDCAGYRDGTSGSPWITNINPATRRGDVYGVIGGLHQGGCTPQVSYSSYFGSDILALYNRATHGGSGDDMPPAGSDGC